VTVKAPATQTSIQRAIRAARKEGLHVLGVRPDGTILTGESPIPVNELVPSVPQTEDEAEREFWEKVK
jgi:hypothetical protein